MKDILCPLCGSSEFTIRYAPQLDGAEDAFHYLTEKPCHYRIVDCRACGMTYSSPIFDEEKIIQLYRACNTEQAQGPAEEKAILANMRRYLARLRRDSGIQSGRLLDIGCGLGQLLVEAREMGYDVFGVDPSEEAVAAARGQLGPDRVICSTYSEGLFPAEQFDLITLVHVIDHVVSPADLLKSIRKHLKPGGHAFIATHNIDSLLARITGRDFIAWSIQHISYYTPDTLRSLARMAGLEPVALRGSLTTYPLMHFAKNGIRSERLRKATLDVLSRLAMSQWQVSFPFGNIELTCAKGPEPREAAHAD